MFLTPPEAEDYFPALTRADLRVSASSAQEGVETQREALEAMRKEMDRERASMAEEIERLEKELEETTTQATQFEAELTIEREAGQDKAGQVTELTIENARLGEQVKAEQAGAQATENALKTATDERERDRERREKEIEQECLQRERLQTELEAERKARSGPASGGIADRDRPPRRTGQSGASRGAGYGSRPQDRNQGTGKRPGTVGKGNGSRTQGPGRSGEGKRCAQDRGRAPRRASGRGGTPGR